MRTEVPAVVSKLETCEQETGWADFISIEISKKALFCRPTLFRNEFRELLIRANTHWNERSAMTTSTHMHSEHTHGTYTHTAGQPAHLRGVSE